MNIKFITLSDRLIEERSYRDAYIIKAAGIKLKFCEGEPEDARLGRDYNDVFKIKELVKAAYDSGLAGLPLTFEEVVSDDDEWYLD